MNTGSKMDIVGSEYRGAGAVRKKAENHVMPETQSLAEEASINIC